MRTYWGYQWEFYPDPVISIDTGSDQPAITHHCPNCEAAARELADIAAVLRTGSSGDTLLGKEVSRWIDTAHAAEQERDDLRARLTKQVKAWRKDGRYNKTAASIFDACADKVEEILAKTEAK